MKNIEQLAKEFRKAIDVAKDACEFDNDCSFYKFPQGCCGDTSDLLAQYLLENGIKTYYVCGTYRDGTFENMQSHAWLLIDNHIVVDITGDQFKDDPDFLNYNKSVYVGAEDNFHRLFEVEDGDVHEDTGIYGRDCLPRLDKLYKKIIKYI